ncbi:hypothetical protein [Aquicoccus sp. SU-CL01552]
MSSYSEVLAACSLDPAAFWQGAARQVDGSSPAATASTVTSPRGGVINWP